MTKRTATLLQEARRLLEASRPDAQSGFAGALASRSLEAHIADLESLIEQERLQAHYEILELRLSADVFRAGTIPLGILSEVSAGIRRMFGFAALRFGQGGIGRKRVPDTVYQSLDLRLAGLMPGSSRLLIAAAAHRDLFDHGPAEQTLSRVFSIVSSSGAGQHFLEGISDLGPASARNLRDVLRVVRAQSAAMHLEWSHRGQTIAQWTGDKPQVDQLTAALERTELKDRRVQIISGTVEMLSKRERIQIRDETGALLRVLFPSTLLGAVSALHIDQQVSLRCARHEMENPLTGESSVSYEMLGMA